ncbi:hypothetical protein SKAU_G00352820 [Synaphobranchus kaupii]|uniref:Uncharacterized protein n=1 Tax=Synaphobranchus kaupii TaxID=118154 RepID=A0A9Q1IID3_SYNKA|nr:hypothetical protein SKAU_G00352820 [Synaphobranchus kaupii]
MTSEPTSHLKLHELCKKIPFKNGPPFVQLYYYRAPVLTPLKGTHSYSPVDGITTDPGNIFPSLYLLHSTRKYQGLDEKQGNQEGTIDEQLRRESKSIESERVVGRRRKTAGVASALTGCPEGVFHLRSSPPLSSDGTSSPVTPA